MIGQRLLHYEIVEKLGEGGMGVVYKARDTHLDRFVAVKVLPPEKVADTERKRRFVQEAKAASALNHPNIITIYDISSDAGRLFIAMEHVAGKTLDKLIPRNGMQLSEALKVAAQIADALARAHQAGIIHRDLKPANIMVDAHGLVKVLDFGLAKLTEGGISADSATVTIGARTDEGAVVGTAAYMSPEQARGEKVDARTDLFAFGAVLYQMLTGRQAFPGSSTAVIFEAVLNRRPAALRMLSPQTPVHLEEIVDKALEKDRTLRYQSAAHLCADLERLRNTLSAPAAARPEQASIVVLPFENLSPDPDNAFFADGLTEELIADLSKIRALRVISRTSAMHYKGTTKPLPAIARELNVRHVLEGSVRRAGNSLRITAQLIDAATDAHLWAEKYAGTLDDVFDLQERLSRRIVEGLKVALSGGEAVGFAGHPQMNRAAYEAYLRARHEVARYSEDALDRAVTYLQAALDTAGESAFLLGSLAYVYSAYVTGGFRLDEDARRKAEDCATRALALDPTTASAHSALGSLAFMRGDPRRAFSHYQRALSRDWDDSSTVLSFVWTAGAVGRMAASGPITERLMEADPLNAVSHLACAAQLFCEGRYEAAIAPAQIAARFDPGSMIARYVCALVLAANRRFAEAHSILDRWRSETPEHPYLVALTSWVYAFEGRHTESAGLLAGFLANDDLRELMRSDSSGLVLGAEIHALNGDTDEALEWLEHGLANGVINYPYLSTIDPWLNNLRRDPRFDDLMSRVRREWEEFVV
jgi:serine/threonine protein kinase